MSREFLSHARPALAFLAAFTLLTGLAYPLAMTAAAQALFPRQANGSLIEKDGRVLGSELIAQPFAEARYFWPRPSAADHDAAASSGSNLAPSNPELLRLVQERADALRAADPENKEPIPVDLVTASGSGLDPHLSPAAVRWQIPRVARARGLDPAALEKLAERHVEGRAFGLLGEPRANVLLLNLALDAWEPAAEPSGEANP
jgi:K+-transporting ATPase ATPase C chain